jgi:hypothetical protein
LRPLPLKVSCCCPASRGSCGTRCKGHARLDACPR